MWHHPNQGIVYQIQNTTEYRQSDTNGLSCYIFRKKLSVTISVSNKLNFVYKFSSCLLLCAKPSASYTPAPSVQNDVVNHGGPDVPAFLALDQEIKGIVCKYDSRLGWVASIESVHKSPRPDYKISIMAGSISQRRIKMQDVQVFCYVGIDTVPNTP